MPVNRTRAVIAAEHAPEVTFLELTLFVLVLAIAVAGVAILLSGPVRSRFKRR